jgi:pimeloyl-ACP methyl ester carboxylesterase
MHTSLTQRRIRLPHGIELSCRCAGDEGQPVLMFLHGFPEAAFVWDELLAHFSQAQHGGYFCIAPNLRGYADSSAPLPGPRSEPYRAKHLMQDLQALAQACSSGPLAALVAHDWGGALAWNLASLQPGLMQRLVIINAPHPALFARELSHSPAQQAASRYMNFLARPDAAKRLAEGDFRRLWALFEGMGATNGPQPWLCEAVREQYRQVWRAGLAGPCAYYAASPLRPPEPGSTAHPLQVPAALAHTPVPTQVIWGMADTALLPGLLDGLADHVPDLELHRIADATHWIVHEQPALVARLIGGFLARPGSAPELSTQAAGQAGGS